MNREGVQRNNTGTAVSILKSIPAGTILVTIISLTFFIINLFTSYGVTSGTCVASTNVTNGIPWQLYRVSTYPLAHYGFYHQIVALFLFPLSTSHFESRVGTFQFLYLFFILSALVASIYIVVIWFISWGIRSWGIACIGGLDIPFFIFLTIDALNNQGLFDVATRMGLKIPNVLFPFPFVALFFILMPFTSWTSHLFAIGVGILYYTGGLKFLQLSSRALNALDTTKYLAFISNHPSFIMKPGDVVLPMPGAYDANRPYFKFNSSTNSMESGSFLTQVSNVFRNDKYTPIHSYEGMERQADPLLWDEEDENDDRANTKLPGSPSKQG